MRSKERLGSPEGWLLSLRQRYLNVAKDPLTGRSHTPRHRLPIYGVILSRQFYVKGNDDVSMFRSIGTGIALAVWSFVAGLAIHFGSRRSGTSPTGRSPNRRPIAIRSQKTSVSGTRNDPDENASLDITRDGARRRGRWSRA